MTPISVYMLRRRTLLAGGLALGAGVAIGRGDLDDMGARAMDQLNPSRIDSIRFEQAGRLVITLEPDHGSDIWAIWHVYQDGLGDAIVSGESPEFSGPIERSFIGDLYDSGTRYPSPDFYIGLFTADEPDIETEEDLLRAMLGDMDYERIEREQFSVPSTYHDEVVFEEGVKE